MLGITSGFILEAEEDQEDNPGQQGIETDTHPPV